MNAVLRFLSAVVRRTTITATVCWKRTSLKVRKSLAIPGRCEAEKKCGGRKIYRQPHPEYLESWNNCQVHLMRLWNTTLQPTYHDWRAGGAFTGLYRTVKRLRPKHNEDEEEPTVTLPTAIACCISLNLEPVLSEVLVAKAGFSFRNTKTGTAYRLVLHHMYFYFIYQCNDALVFSGVKPLTKASWKIICWKYDVRRCIGYDLSLWCLSLHIRFG